MFIGWYAKVLPTPFEGAEVNQAFITQFRSAPSNGAGGGVAPGYKHVTPTGRKPVALLAR